MFGAILTATNSSFQKGMAFCRSTYVKKVIKLLAFIFEQPSYNMICHAIVFLVNMVFSSGYCVLLLFYFSVLNSLISFLARSARKRTCRYLNSKVPHRRKPDTHDETFICNLCMQFLCVPYTTVQTMKPLYATSHYLLLFPAKIMHTFSTWCLLRRTKLLFLYNNNSLFSPI